MRIRVGVDASRNRSGGAQAHLIGILSHLEPQKHGISEVHVWSFHGLLEKLPDRSWLIRHNPEALEGSLLSQLVWQATALKGELVEAGCNILFSTDASTLCQFYPMVVLSQDMLSYEPGIMEKFGYGLNRLRLEIILRLQNRVFQRANGVIFLTEYAGRIIQNSCGALSRFIHIPHGVDEIFRPSDRILGRLPKDAGRSIECIYVSNADIYKNQSVVVESVARLRKRGYELKLTLVGGGNHHGLKLLESTLGRINGDTSFLKRLDFISHDALPELIAQSDIYIFASSCENMPVTLIEGMAMGLPIACSDRGPMPEVLLDGGVYFDPEKVDSVVNALEMLISSPSLRDAVSMRAKELAEQYTWQRCADETFAFIANMRNGPKQ